MTHVISPHFNGQVGALEVWSKGGWGLPFMASAESLRMRKKHRFFQVWVEVRAIWGIKSGNLFGFFLLFEQLGYLHRSSKQTVTKAKQDAALTCVVNPLTLDFALHARALLHIPQVNPSPRLSDVIKAQVCGFIAFPWKEEVEMWEEIRELKTSLCLRQKKWWMAVFLPLYLYVCGFSLRETITLKIKKLHVFLQLKAQYFST